MQLRTALLIVVLLLAAAVGWVWYRNAHTGLSPTIEPLREEFTWSFVDRGVNATTSMPATDVALRVAGVDVPLGTYDGNCFAIAGSQWPLLANELSGAICYFAGGGTEIGVFEEGGKLILKKGDVDEGDAEHAGTRGNFVPLSKQLTP
ncbi:MAG: hypothetical protein V4474_00630 [Patescibacteria group bacterium]